MTSMQGLENIFPKTKIRLQKTQMTTLLAKPINNHTFYDFNTFSAYIRKFSSKIKLARLPWQFSALLLINCYCTGIHKLPLRVALEIQK